MNVRNAIGSLIWWIGQTASRRTGDPTRYWFRILGGPAMGKVLAVPSRERPSMVIGTYERHVVRCMRKFVRRGSVVYDVGAHVGYLSLVASRLVGTHGRVLSIEANPQVEALLKGNLHANSMTNAQTLQVAVSDEVGMSSFATFPAYSTVGHISGPGTPSDAEIVQVRCVTLDSLVADGNYGTPDFIKIDVEGAEMKVLTGAAATLKAHQPFVVVEVRIDQTLEPVRSFMESIGYTAHVLNLTAGNASEGVVDIAFSVNR